MRLIPALATFLAAVALAPIPAAANGDAARGAITIPLIARAPRIEEFLAADSLPGQLRIDDFRQRQPTEGAPVSQQTTAFLSYDQSNLYAVFVCKDEPGKVRAGIHLGIGRNVVRPLAIRNIRRSPVVLRDRAMDFEVAMA